LTIVALIALPMIWSGMLGLVGVIIGIAIFMIGMDAL